MILTLSPLCIHTYSYVWYLSCLKLYCECAAHGVACSQAWCACWDCHNTEALRSAARGQMEAQEETAASPSQQRRLLQAMRQYLAQQEQQEKEGAVNHDDDEEK